VDFLRFENAGVAVDMAMARQKESRKAMEQLETFVLKIRGDLDTILTLENSVEVYAEYRLHLNLQKAILTAQERREAVAQMCLEIQKERESKQEQEQHREQLLAAAPELREQLPQEETYTMTFTVTGPLPELKALKAYILTRNLTIEEDEHE
jgi:alkyl sulfatase BDS1-like metallo-beta-lactamase superfamily hydrolase